MRVFYAEQASGRYLGAFTGAFDTPAGAVGVPLGPEDGRQVWNGAGWEWPVEIIRAEKLSAIQQRFESQLEAGLDYGGKVLQIRSQDQINLTTMGNEARWALAMNAPWPADFAWRMADDSFLPVAEAATMIALAEAAKAEVYRLNQLKWQHVDAVRALAEAGAIANYDFNIGW